MVKPHTKIKNIVNRMVKRIIKRGTYKNRSSFKKGTKKDRKRGTKRDTKRTRRRSHSKRYFMSCKKRRYFMGGGIGETIKTVDGMPIAKKDVVIASSDGGVRTVAEYEEHALMRNQQGDDLY
jgi:hypothetical protein